MGLTPLIRRRRIILYSCALRPLTSITRRRREDENLGVEIRPFSWPDIEAIARLHRACEPVDHGGRLGDATALRERWRQPDRFPEKECLVAVAQGAVVGYALRSLLDGTDQCLVDGVVHPAWRRQGIGRRLLEHTANEARRAGIRTIEVRTRDDEPATIAFCEALGFSLQRIWHRMWLEPLRLPPLTVPPGYGWRSFRPHHDEKAYVEIVNDAMAGHWGIGPIHIDNILHLTNQPSFEPADIVFATYGREIVGVCAVRFLERAIGSHSVTAGHIGPIAVRQPHRGRGLAHALLAISLRQCRRRHVQAAELDVDAENAPALHVYQDCGFETLFRILWYRRELSQARS